MYPITEFSKYHGLSNDFVLVDLSASREVDDCDFRAASRLLGDRRTGVGCDQVMLMLPASKETCEAKIRIFNGPDGSEVEACGNGTRSVVAYLCQRLKRRSVTLETPVGDLRGGVRGSEDDVEVEQGVPRFLSESPLVLQDYGLRSHEAFAVNVGNPHLVIFFNDSEASEEEASEFGTKLENHPFFPERTNVEFCFAEPGRSVVHVKMFERGAGRTRACGSGACAVAFAALRGRGVEGEGDHGRKSVEVVMEGGPLRVSLDPESGVVRHRGQARRVFTAVLDPGAFWGTGTQN